MKLIPNCISLIRIIFSISLIILKPLSLTFYVIYIICGVSDILDGFIARRTGTTSNLGAKLDSFADMIMAGVLLVVFYPIIKLEIVFIIWIGLIGIIRLTSMVVAFKKYKTFASLHTYSNKITGLFLFIFLLLIPYFHITVLLYIICGVASLSAMEELIIQLTSRKLELNKKTIFTYR